MDNDAARPVSIKLVIGLFLAVAGTLMTLGNFGFVDAEPILEWWSLVLVVIGGLLAMQGRWIVGVIWAVIGAWILGWNLGVVRWSVGDLWPFLLIGIGIVLVRQGISPAGTPSDTESRVDMLGCFFANVRSSASTDFRGGTMTAIMGGASLDLTAADIREGVAVIDVFAMWGGVEIRVPRSWSVAGHVTPIMAGFEDKTQPAPDARKRLVVRGAALMGGVEVKN